MTYIASLGRGLILHLKIIKDERRFLNNQPFYYIVSAIEHTLLGFKPNVWTEEQAFEGRFYNSISNAENAIAKYFSDRDIILKKGVDIII